MLSSSDVQKGILDNRFLAQSIGLLNPPHPLSLQQTKTVGEALQLLKKNKIGCLAITDTADRLLGIFTERDLLLKLNLEQIDQQQLIAEVMTKEPKTATMTDSIAYVLQLMSQGGFRHVPIIDQDRHVVGMVSVKDIVDALVGRITKEISALAE